MCEIYIIFAQDWKDCLDFSDQSKIDLFNHESFGSQINKNNGFYVGKKYLNVHVKMWKEDIDSGLLFEFELYKDEKFPHWWLDSILKK